MQCRPVWPQTLISILQPRCKPSSEAPYELYNCAQKEKRPVWYFRAKLGYTIGLQFGYQYIRFSKHVYGLLLWHYKRHLLIKNNRHSVSLIPSGATLSLAGETEDSPGPAPAPEPELLPSDLSSDWPTGREGGMVNVKIQGMGHGGRRGSNNKNHTWGLVAHENVWSHRGSRRNLWRVHTLVCEQSKHALTTSEHRYPVPPQIYIRNRAAQIMNLSF